MDTPRRWVRSWKQPRTCAWCDLKVPQPVFVSFALGYMGDGLRVTARSHYYPSLVSVCFGRGSPVPNLLRKGGLGSRSRAKGIAESPGAGNSFKRIKVCQGVAKARRRSTHE